MLHPRILNNYNYKRQDVDKKEKNKELDKCEMIISPIKKALPNFAELKADNNSNAGNNEGEPRMQFEMGVSVSKKQSVICSSAKVVQTTTQHSINVVQLVPHTSTKVYQLVPKSSQRVAQCVTNSSIKRGQIKDGSSLRAGKVGQSSSLKAGKLAVSHSSGRVVKLVPHSSTRVARLVSNSSMKMTHLIPNSPKKIPALVPTFSPMLSQILTNSSAKVTQLRSNLPVKVAELISNPSTRVMQLVSNSPAQVLQLVPTGSPKIGQTAPCSPKKVPPLIKFSPTKATSCTPNSPTSSVPRVSTKPSIKSIQRLSKRDGNNFVMILPVPGKEATTIQPQTICTPEKIQNSKDVARVQQVIGVQRQHCASENNSLDNDSPKLGIVSPQIIETKLEDNVTKESSTKSENKDNIDSKEEIAEIDDVPLSEETFEEEKVDIQSEKPDSNNSENDLSDIAKKISSAVQKTNTEGPQADVELVNVKETMNEPESSRKRRRTSVSNKKQGRTSVSNRKQARTSVSNRRKMEEKVPGKKTTRMMTKNRKSTILMTRRRNTKLETRPNQTKPKISALARIQGQITKTLASLNPPVKNKWRAQCIICKDRFTDKYEFHRHVTLSHPGIRIVFCELCNASFRSDIELKQHRYSYHKITVTKDAENNLIKLEAPIKPIVTLGTELVPPRPKIKGLDERRHENRKKMANDRCANFESIPGRSTNHFRSRSIRKKVTGSCMKMGKSKGNLQLDSVAIGPQKTKSQNKTIKSKYSYVDIDIIDHEAITNNETFINAEERKLIIPIVRLEGFSLEKYLMKFIKKPVTNFTSTGINEHTNLLDTKKTIRSRQKQRSFNSRSNRVSRNSANPATRLISRKRQRNLLSKKALQDEKNVTICHDAKVVPLNLSNANPPAALRRSVRCRKYKKPFDSNSEEISNNGFAKIKPLDDGIESTINKESQKLENPNSDNFRSSQDLTLINVEDEPGVAEIVEEQRVIKKLVSRSSVSTCSTTFDHNRDQDDSNFEVLNADDVDMVFSKRGSSIYSSKKSSELSSPSNDEVSSLLPKNSGPTRRSKKSMRKSFKFEESESIRARHSTSIGSDEKSITDKRTTKVPRFSCDNLYDNDLSNNSDGSENRDGKSDETSNKHDEKAVVNKNIREKNSIVSKREKTDTQAKEKVDDENKLSEEKIDGEDNQEKNQNSNDGKNVDEKSTGDGKQNNGSVNEEEKYSNARSNVTDKLRKKQSDDEDEEPKKRINDEGKKLKEKIEDDDEQDEKSKDEKKQLERKGQDENEKLEEKSKYKQLTNQNDSNIKNQPEHSNNSEDEKCLNDKNNAGVVTEKETVNSAKIKTPTDFLESPIRKTYSSSKKLSKVSKQPKQSRNKIEKFQNFCSVCTELCTLMKKVSSQVGDRNTTAIPIKCPLCQRYFISMFHLELHVATNHLQCQNEIPCKIAKSPVVKKPSTRIGSDCEIKIDMAIECLRCSMKFSTNKDLNDHLIAKHEIRYPKGQSSNVYPKHRDLRTSLLEPNSQKNIVTSSQSSEGTGSNFTLETDKKKVTPATLHCSLCDEKFVDSTKYVHHVREIHNASKPSSSLDRKKNSTKSLSHEEKLCSLDQKKDSTISLSHEEKLSPSFKEPPPKVSEGSSAYTVDKLKKAIEIEKADPMTSDRDYVLKQLLSDNSSSDEGEKNSESNHSKSSSLKGPTKESIVQKSKDQKVADRSTRFYSCEICQNQFKRAQDLLLHRLSHNDKISKDDKNGEDGRKTEYEDRSEVFVQSDSEDDDSFGESENTKYDEFSPLKEREFVYHSENERDNVAVLFGTNGASEKVVVGSKRRATLASYEMSEISKNKEKAIPVKKHKISNADKSPDKSINPIGKEPRDVRKYVTKQLIETEVSLAGKSNEKLPIACGKCNRHFANSSLLNEHLFFLHDDSLKDTVLTDVLTPIGGLRGFDEAESSQHWSCESCVQNFKLFQGYSRHRYFVHADDSMVHVCDNCSKVMTNVTMVNVHICTDVASYNCRTCNETFPTGMSLRLHNTEKHMETNGPHNCKVCRKKFLTNGMLERHINNKHRFVRIYRVRKKSPVRMAKPDLTNEEDLEKAMNSEKRCEKEIDKSPMKGTPEKDEDSIMAGDVSELRRGSWRSCRSKKKVEAKRPVSQKSPNSVGDKKKRGRLQKNSLPEEESSSKWSQDEDDKEYEEYCIVYKDKSLYVDEAEIHQCALCQLYCLSRSTLRSHMEKIHSTTDEICQLCQQMYPTGKLIRHMIERHITSDDGEVLGLETSWRMGTNSNEIDAEILIKMLGIDRLVSLCEYRRYSDKNNLTSYSCLFCKKYFDSHELYRYHFLLHHDALCALCNIEFKTGHDAARHKIEIHGSVERYIWFADRTIMQLISTKNFTDATENIFMERITREEKACNDEAEEIDEDEKPMQHSAGLQALLSNNLKENSGTFSKETIRKDDFNAMKEKIVTADENIIPRDEKSGFNIDTAGKIVDAAKTAEKSIDPNSSTKTTSDTSVNPVPTTSSAEETLIDNVPSASDYFIQPDDVNLIIVVTDDDLERFNITTRHPNIWGLAAKISSTYSEITPKQVKKMLECHFERQKDFDA